MKITKMRIMKMMKNKIKIMKMKMKIMKERLENHQQKKIILISLFFCVRNTESVKIPNYIEIIGMLLINAKIL